MANNPSMNQYKVPGTRGPRNMQKVEKAKDGKQTIKRLLQYFAEEKKLLIYLLLVVLMIVVCSVIAPKLQSQAIDSIAQASYEDLGGVLLVMLSNSLTDLA